MPGSLSDPCRPAAPPARSATGTRRRAGRAALGTAAAAALLLPLVSAAPSATADQREDRALQREFTTAAQRYKVPQSVLLGVSFLQSRWDTHDGAPSVTGGYGPMHLTDARTALKRSAREGHHATEDARGDTARPARTAAAEKTLREARSGELPSRLRTLARAAQLTGLSPERLRTSPAANVRGGAALLADAQKRLGRPPSSDPADWYGAVAAYPGGTGKADSRTFADDVFSVLRKGERQTTDSGQYVTLQARPGLRPANAPSRAQGAASGSPVECPKSVSCEWVPAPYEKYKNEQGEEDYGNHDTARRPASQKIDYIVVHDVEGSYEGALKLIKDPEYVSWQYTLRSSDGHIAQHVPLKDVAWHAGNWYINSKSVGLEHEGFLTDPDAWYTEAMYRTSARLVRYLSQKYDIPLDRQHIIGHDNVPGTTTSSIAGMHTDPGPYWDWQHYFALLGRPFHPEGAPGGKLVTVNPRYATNQPVYTGCKKAGEPCAPHGSGAVRLHTAPDAGSPLVKDAGLRPDGSASTTGVNDTGARASTGQQFAVAGRKGDWTAIWYLGGTAWFHNPPSHPTAVTAKGSVITPKAGKQETPVYGRAYPEASAYPADIPVQKLSPLPYTVKAGQRYAAGPKERGEYLYATEFDPKAERFTVVRGGLTYYQIQLGHRVAYVKADDVQLSRAGS